MSNFLSVFLGVISGVITSSILFFSAWAFREFLLPKLKSYMYKGVSITGTWEVSSPEYDRRKITFHLTQVADKVTGTSAHVLNDKNSDERADETRAYRLEGFVRDGYLYLLGTSVDRSRTGAAAFLFHIVGGGQTMRGEGLGYSSSKDAIISHPLTAECINEPRLTEV